MYVKKATKKSYYKNLIIIFTILIAIELLDYFILNEPIHYEFLIFYLGGVCLGTWNRYKKHKENMNGKGEVVIEDEFTIKLKNEFDHRFLLFIFVLVFSIYNILKWLRINSLELSIVPWSVVLLMLIYYSSRYVFISNRTE
ncbi:hypothetical protein [Macrococcoides caseolyticum]|uniref:hypothetical protein n=1 Tax=Macrococcoides caseolyticum TaxID=69966 RepID=UPI001F3F604B|nr:hypothetical protein [Macrococcus caseolyticus]MCE4955973.1 hypothetical protein [Macrococcus caseolyticus]